MLEDIAGVWEGPTAGARGRYRSRGTKGRARAPAVLTHARAIFEGPGGVGQEGLGERSLTVFAPREGRGHLLFLAGSVVCAGTTAGGGVGSSEGGKGGGEGGGETWKTSVAVASA